MAPASAPHESDDRAQAAQGFAFAPAGLHHEIRSSAFFKVGHLLGQDRLEPLLRHPRARQNPRGLYARGGGYHDHRVAKALAAGFEQQGDIQYNDRTAAARVSFQETQGLSSHPGMEDSFEPGEGCGVFEHPLRQFLPIDGALTRYAWKCRFDLINGGSATREELVDRRIGVVDRNAETAKHPGGEGLAHAYGAGKAENDHAAGQPQAASTKRRRSSVTSG